MPQLLHMVVLPLFFFVFLLIYRPFGVTPLFGSAWFGVHVAVLSAIIMLCTIVTRLLYYYLPLKLNYSLYSLWCFGEIVVMTIFGALYLWRVMANPSPYLDVLTRIFEIMLFTLSIPYAVLALSIRLYDYHSKSVQPDTGRRMRFYDVSHNLKIVLTSDTILYIGAEENYIHIYYTDGGRVKSYVLRNSMKSIDELCLSNGLVRCHRSFYVNPAHIRVLRKEKEGVVFAELEASDVRDIPVSKKYYGSLSDML